MILYEYSELDTELTGRKKYWKPITITKNLTEALAFISTCPQDRIKKKNEIFSIDGKKKIKEIKVGDIEDLKEIYYIDSIDTKLPFVDRNTPRIYRTYYINYTQAVMIMAKEAGIDSIKDYQEFRNLKESLFRRLHQKDNYISDVCYNCSISMKTF